MCEAKPAQVQPAIYSAAWPERWVVQRVGLDEYLQLFDERPVADYFRFEWTDSLLLAATFSRRDLAKSFKVGLPNACYVRKLV